MLRSASRSGDRQVTARSAHRHADHGGLGRQRARRPRRLPALDPHLLLRPTAAHTGGRPGACRPAAGDRRLEQATGAPTSGRSTRTTGTWTLRVPSGERRHHAQRRYGTAGDLPVDRGLERRQGAPTSAIWRPSHGDVLRSGARRAAGELTRTRRTHRRTARASAERLRLRGPGRRGAGRRCPGWSARSRGRRRAGGTRRPTLPGRKTGFLNSTSTRAESGEPVGHRGDAARLGPHAVRDLPRETEGLGGERVEVDRVVVTRDRGVARGPGRRAAARRSRCRGPGRTARPRPAASLSPLPVRRYFEVDSHTVSPVPPRSPW